PTHLLARAPRDAPHHKKRHNNAALQDVTVEASVSFTHAFSGAPMLRRFSFRCRSFRPRRSASLPAHRRPRDDCTYETLELEKGKSSFGSALHPDCGCGDRVGVRSAAHWNAGGILGGDCHTCSDAIDPG